MATLLESNEIFFTAFEPKQPNRFVLYIEGIPSWLIKVADRPKVQSTAIALPHINVERKVKGKTTWQDFSFTMYDPVSPSGAQTAMEWLRLSHESVSGRDGYSDFYKKDLTLHMLGPLGDIVEEWTIKGAFPTSIEMGSGDFNSDGPMEINVTCAVDYAILQY